MVGGIYYQADYKSCPSLFSKLLVSYIYFKNLLVLGPCRDKDDTIKTENATTQSDSKNLKYNHISHMYRSNL